MTKVFVTGMGIISALGKSKNENLERLRSGITGIGKTNHLESKFADTHLFGEVNCTNEELICALNLKNKKGLTRTDLFALTAFKEAVGQARLSSSELNSPDTAFISSSTVGGMCLTKEIYEDANLLSKGSDYLSSYGFAAHTLRIVEEYNLRGFTSTINTACSSSANAILLGARLIKSGRAKRAIVGGTDCLSKFTINGFNSLQILSPEACKPFDENRTGLTLGEGAAYLVLEPEDCGKEKIKLAEIKGYGNANDAFHPSALSEEATGVTEAIGKALRSANIRADQVDYINAHGTATQNNDITELRGILKSLNKIPPFNSTKSYTGHTLAAAGAIEAVYSIFSLQYGELYPSLNCKNPIAEFNCAPIEKFQKNKKMKFVLSNSFGFAGNCTSLIIAQTS